MNKKEFKALIKEEIKTVLKEAMAYGEKEAADEINSNPKIEDTLKKIKGYESIVSGKPGTVYVYFKQRQSAIAGAKILDKMVPGPDYENSIVQDSGSWVIEVEPDNVNEAAVYPIELSNVNVIDGRLIFTIGNSSADLAGYKIPEDKLAKLQEICKQYLDAVQVPTRGGMFSGGELQYKAQGPVYMSKIMKAAELIKALNLTHSY